MPTDGAFPLSYTLDSIGPIARSVADCASADWVMADAVMAGEEFSFAPLDVAALKGLRFGVAEGLPLDRIDDTVASAFDARRSNASTAPACG